MGWASGAPGLHVSIYCCGSPACMGEGAWEPLQTVQLPSGATGYAGGADGGAGAGAGTWTGVLAAHSASSTSRWWSLDLWLLS